MSTLRILLVVDYAFSYLGGAQTAVVQQALALHDAGHEVTVAAPDAASAPGLTGTGVELRDIAPVVPFPLLGLPLIRADAATCRTLRSLMREARTDLVITHSEHGLAAAALRVARERGVPTMHTVHTFFLAGPAWGAVLAPVAAAAHRALTGLADPGVRLAPRRLDSVLRGMTLAVGREADLVLSPSRHQAEALRRAGLASVQVVSNTSGAARATVAPPADDGPLRLVWAARFAPEKRLAVVLEAMERVEARLGSGAVHLDVAGGRLRHPSRASGITVHGRVPTSGVAALLRTAHAAVITSLGFDNQPMIAIEAFAAGRPVVVSDPVLAGEFGAAAIPASSSDAAGLAATIVRLAEERRLLDEPSRAAVRAAAAAAPHAHARTIEAAHARIAAVPPGAAGPGTEPGVSRGGRAAAPGTSRGWRPRSPRS